MRASQFFSALALAATTALARRSYQHVGTFGKRLEEMGRSLPAVGPPVVKREYQEHAQRATTPKFLTDKTSSKKDTLLTRIIG